MVMIIRQKRRGLNFAQGVYEKTLSPSGVFLKNQKEKNLRSWQYYST